MSDQTLPVDTHLDDFRITSVLGEGGFGITYKAVDERLQRDVAIKEYLPRQFAFRDEAASVRPRGPQDQEVFTWGLTRFIDEARALALFKHPNIVAVIRYLEANGTAYLVMEYEEGKDLERWLLGRSESVPEELLVERILRPLLDGLARIHEKGMLHRDIKPENVFIRRDGSPVLIDFGSSRALEQGQTNALTSIVSAGYSPFEQYGGAQKQGPWSDLYALAGTAYRVIAGTAPTDAIARHQGVEQPTALAMGAGRYSEPLLHAIDQALALDPKDRPQSAAAFAALLPGHRAGTKRDESVTQVRPASAQRPKRRWFPIAIGSLVMATLAAGVFVFYAGLLPGVAVQPSLPSSAQSSVKDETPPAATNAAPQAVEATSSDSNDATSRTTDKPPDPGTEPGTPTVNPNDERAIVAGWSVPDDIDNYRDSQIAGALLAYTSNKEKFDDCLTKGCAELPTLMAKIEEALQGYQWSRGDFDGAIRLSNPRRLDNPDCPFLIDVEETLHGDQRERSQQRSYCTRNGFDRRVEKAGAISERAIVGAAS